MTSRISLWRSLLVSCWVDSSSAAPWWTVHEGPSSDHAGPLWFVGSLLLRTGVILAGFYFVSQNHWSRLVMCLLGFLIARVFVVKRLTHEPAEEPTPLEEETSSAPYSR